MAPSPIPAPLPPWAKAALWLEPFIDSFLNGLISHAGDYHAIEGETPPDEWRRIIFHWEDLESSNVKDDAQFSLDLVNITNGVIDSSWTDNDYLTVANYLSTQLPNLMPMVASRFKLSELKWYRMAFNPYTNQKPFMESGPPVRITPFSLNGTGAGNTPPAVSIVVTERTAWPHHHGRMYMPPPPSAGVGTQGRVPTASVDSLANFWATVYTGLASAEFFPVVPVTQVDSKPNRALLTVSEIWVDDRYDTVRRRHHEDSLHVAKAPATP